MLYFSLVLLWLLGSRLVQYILYKRKRDGLRDNEVLIRAPYGLGIIPEVQLIHNNVAQKWVPSYTTTPYLIAKVGDVIKLTSHSSSKTDESREISFDLVGKDLVIIRKQHLLLTGFAFGMLCLLFGAEYMEDTHEQLSNYLLEGAVVLMLVWFYLLFRFRALIIRPVDN